MWDLGEKISFDEATHGFKGKHSLNHVIKSKKEGDGYLLDWIGDDGFIYTFPLQKNPAPRNGWKHQVQEQKLSLKYRALILWTVMIE